MGNSHKMTRAAELETLPIFREFLDRSCREYGIVSEVRDDLKLAIDEACTNIISHGYEGMNPGSIILEVLLQPTRILLNITDFGHPFEPAETSAPDIHALLKGESTGGFGLYLIYQTMDSVDYQTTVDCNRLTLIKKLPDTSTTG
jgi:anti-sigma regulatory factor (Ser/Thr protein kinase)